MVCGPCVWLLSPSSMFSRFIHVACMMTLFLFVDEQHSVIRTHHTLFTYPSADGHLGCLHASAVVTRLARTSMCTFLFVSVFTSWGTLSSCWSILWIFWARLGFKRQQVGKSCTYWAPGALGSATTTLALGQSLLLSLPRFPVL